MHTLDALDAAQLRTDVPDFRPGDTLDVGVRVVEGNRSRVQHFQGVVIRRQGGGIRETFTVRKVSFGVGVERTFPVHTPVIESIKVVTRGDVRRAKLYYLRELRGKKAKIKEKRDAVPAKGTAAPRLPRPWPSRLRRLSCPRPDVANGDDARAAMSEISTAPAEDAAPEPKKQSGSFFRELPFLVLIALVLALLIKAFLIQAFYIPSGSMQQTLELQRPGAGQQARLRRPRHPPRRDRGLQRPGQLPARDRDPAVEQRPAAGAARISRALGVGAPGEKDFIKRVIGVPGDRVACCTDGHVTVQPKGRRRSRSTSPTSSTTTSGFCEAGTGEKACPPSARVLVPEGRLWVMGDHRAKSSDSRAHISDENQGTVPIDKVIGQAFVMVWPVGRSSGSASRRPSTAPGPGRRRAGGAAPARALGTLPVAVCAAARRSSAPPLTDRACRRCSRVGTSHARPA